MTQSNHEQYLDVLLKALVELGEQRVAQARWMLEQDGHPDRHEEARQWEHAGLDLAEQAGWALNPENHAIYDDTSMWGNGCRFKDGTTMVIRRPIHPMNGGYKRQWLCVLVTRADGKRFEAPLDLWIPFTLAPADYANHARVIAPWVAGAMLNGVSQGVA
jgi:hypothetical protein